MALNIGDEAPDFMLMNVDGSILSLRDFPDAPAVAVIFSCNHCPYVLAWEDRLIDLQKRFEDKAVQFVLVNANDATKYPADSFEEMQKRHALKKYPFPYVLDDSQDTARAYGAERTPEVFLFDKERKLVYHGAPDDNCDNPASVQKQYLKDAIEAVLSGRNPEVSKTPAVGCTIKWK